MTTKGRLLSTSIAFGSPCQARLSAKTEANATSAAGSAGPKKASSVSSAKVKSRARSRRLKVGRSMADLGGWVTSRGI